MRRWHLVLLVVVLFLPVLAACKPSHRPGTIPGHGPSAGPVEEFEPGEPRP